MLRGVQVGQHLEGHAAAARLVGEYLARRRRDEAAGVVGAPLRHHRAVLLGLERFELARPVGAVEAALVDAAAVVDGGGVLRHRTEGRGLAENVVEDRLERGFERGGVVGAVGGAGAAGCGWTTVWLNRRGDQAEGPAPDCMVRTEQELLDAAKTFQEKLGDDYCPLAAGPLDRMIMMTFYLESKYGEPWVTDSTLNYTVEQLQEGLEWIQSLEDNHVMPDLKTMNAAGDKTITDGQAWITGKYAGIFTWDSSALSASQNLPDDAEYVVGDEIKWGEAANGGFAKVSMGMAITQSCEHPVEAAALINFILNEKEGASIMGTQCGMVCSKAGQEYAKEAGAVNELILEANTKVMAFVDQPFDPCYESTSLKDETNGVYGDVFEGFSYDQYDSAEAAQILYDGICEALA